MLLGLDVDAKRFAKNFYMTIASHKTFDICNEDDYLLRLSAQAHQHELTDMEIN